MVAEGVFPKADGDIIYTSEINRFASAGRFLSMGSTILSTSGTASQIIGSVLVGAGSLSTNSQILLNMNITKGSQDVVTVMFSGISTNFSLTAGSSSSVAHPNGQLTALLGSPLGCSAVLMMHTNGNNFSLTSTEQISWSAGTATSFDAGSAFIVSFQGIYSNNTSQIFYGLQGYRGGV